jgi:hypothetical protein
LLSKLIYYEQAQLLEMYIDIIFTNGVGGHGLTALLCYNNLAIVSIAARFFTAAIICDSLRQLSYLMALLQRLLPGLPINNPLFFNE